MMMVMMTCVGDEALNRRVDRICTSGGFQCGTLNLFCNHTQASTYVRVFSSSLLHCCTADGIFTQYLMTSSGQKTSNAQHCMLTKCQTWINTGDFIYIIFFNQVFRVFWEISILLHVVMSTEGNFRDSEEIKGICITPDGNNFISY